MAGLDFFEANEHYTTKPLPQFGQPKRTLYLAGFLGAPLADADDVDANDPVMECHRCGRRMLVVGRKSPSGRFVCHPCRKRKRAEWCAKSKAKRWREDPGNRKRYNAAWTEANRDHVNAKARENYHKRKQRRQEGEGCG